jgi:hypothetical protein
MLRVRINGIAAPRYGRTIQFGRCPLSGGLRVIGRLQHLAQLAQ